MTRRIAIEGQPDLGALVDLVKSDVPYELLQDGQPVAVVIGPLLWTAYQEYARQEVADAVAAIRRHGGDIAPDAFDPEVVQAIRRLHEVQRGPAPE